MNIEFLREPGYTYDLFHVYTWYFNKEKLEAEFELTGFDDKEYMNEIVEKYLPISDDLQVFFHLNDASQSVIGEKYYFELYAAALWGKYDLNVILEMLADRDQVMEKVLLFYFRELSPEDLAECKVSLPKVNQLIKNAKLPDRVKSALYSFVIDPDSVIRELTEELQAKEKIHAELYEESQKVILERQEQFDYPRFAEDFLKQRNRGTDLNAFEKLYISFSAYNQYTLHWCIRRKVIFVIMGIGYQKALEYLTRQAIGPELDTFGTAVSEKNRVEIMNYILKKGEVTVKEVEQDLGFTTANAYYHLNLMLRYGILSIRNQGRTVLYRLDKGYLQELCEVIRKYTE